MYCENRIACCLVRKLSAGCAFVPCTHRPPTARPLTGLDTFVTAPRPKHIHEAPCQGHLLTLLSALLCRPNTTRVGTPPSWRLSPAFSGCPLPSPCSLWPGPLSISRNATSTQPSLPWWAPSPIRECLMPTSLTLRGLHCWDVAASARLRACIHPAKEGSNSSNVHCVGRLQRCTSPHGGLRRVLGHNSSFLCASWQRLAWCR